MRRNPRAKRGQTTIEYLMLMGAAFITAYVMVTGPLATFTADFLNTIRNGLNNTVRNGEWSNEDMNIGNPGHPSNPSRYRPLHL